MDVSVIIVSYNAAAYLKDCLDSIFNLTKDLKFEVIIVDNNSTDNAVEVAKSFGDKIKLVENKDNKGFGSGINQGAKLATGKYLLTLNPDMLLLENSLKKMFDWMESHPDIAVSTCQFLDSNKKPLPNGGSFPDLQKILFWAFFLDDLPFLAKIIKSYHPRASEMPIRSDPSKINLVDWVTGSFMFIRSEAWQQSGGFDESIFMYGEEVELCYRIKLQKGKIAYVPITQVIHHERKSADESLPKGAVLGEFRGLKYFYGKHFPGWQQIALGTLLDVAAFNRIILWLFRRKMAMVKLYAEALLL